MKMYNEPDDMSITKLNLEIEGLADQVHAAVEEITRLHEEIHEWDKECKNLHELATKATQVGIQGRKLGIKSGLEQAINIIESFKGPVHHSVTKMLVEAIQEALK